MSKLEKEFVPPKQALELQELGFDEKCIGWYPNNTAALCVDGVYIGQRRSSSSYKLLVSAPTFSQAFRWFREKYGLYHSIALDNSLEDDVNCDYQIINHNQSISELETDFKSYEEAELECLKKLIQIVKTKP
jgi:hypothetical protein